MDGCGQRAGWFRRVRTATDGCVHVRIRGLGIRVHPGVLGAMKDEIADVSSHQVAIWAVLVRGGYLSAMREEPIGQSFVLTDIEVVTRSWEEHPVAVDAGLARRDGDARSLVRQGWSW